MRGGIAGRGGGIVGGRGGGSVGGDGGGRGGGKGGGKVKGGGKNTGRSTASTDGIVGGSRFLTADREKELRENVRKEQERRNSEASIVVERSEGHSRQDEHEEMDSEQGDGTGNRNGGEEWPEEG